MIEQVSDMTSSTEINLNSIEAEMTYLEYLQPSRRRPEYWTNLGSSKSRTSAQESESRSVIEGMIENSNINTVIAFTDGSCRGNPGPCGAGACIFLPNSDQVELKQPVAKLASILIGELVAIKMTLEFTIVEKAKRHIDSIKIFSDSQSAVGILQLGWENKTHKKTGADTLQLIKNLQACGTEVQIQWSPGHANIIGNETADRLAKEAAKDAEDMPDDNGVVSQADVKVAARESVSIKWQRRWNLTEQGRKLYACRQTVKPKRMIFTLLKTKGSSYNYRADIVG